MSVALRTGDEEKERLLVADAAAGSGTSESGLRATARREATGRHREGVRNCRRSGIAIFMVVVDGALFVCPSLQRELRWQ